MDETAFLSATRWRRTQFVSGLVDTATGRLLDVVPDRTARAVMGWLSARDRAWLERIGVVALDPRRGYANAVGCHLGHATLVVDRFHIERLAGAMIDDVRRRVQQEQTGHRGRNRDPLYRIRKLLLAAADRLDPRGWQRLTAGLAAGDPHGEVAAAWQAKEITRDLYRAEGADRARGALALLHAWADNSAVPEVRRFARTIRRWEDEVLAWHTTGGASNGPPKRSTSPSSRSSASGGAPTTTGCGSCCTAAASHGTINPPRGSGGAPHAWWRRAGFDQRRPTRDTARIGREPVLVRRGEEEVLLRTGWHDFADELSRQLDMRRHPWRALVPFEGRHRWVAGTVENGRVRLWVERMWFPTWWRPVWEAYATKYGGNATLAARLRPSRAVPVTDVAVAVLVNLVLASGLSAEAFRANPWPHLAIIAGTTAFFILFFRLQYFAVGFFDRRVLEGFVSELAASFDAPPEDEARQARSP